MASPGALNGSAGTIRVQSALAGGSAPAWSAVRSTDLIIGTAATVAISNSTGGAIAIRVRIDARSEPLSRSIAAR
ncbi:hypothetical protein Atai01_43690 [Amycolatopsis taiwanensis]|uniref:Uncharacterized protein n=1 Tax=Amycolatopsis taiwanensis TaxID=342230 RepID=A0A9W6R5A9_9PSEU|nr:hypothetical protein Atai01_43690 [Amycolatopsis taiwanensis]